MTPIAGENDLRSAIVEAVAARDVTLARTLLRQFFELRPGPATAPFVVARFREIADELPATRLRLAILRSSTLEPVVPVLTAAAWVSDIRLDVHVGDFNAYAQEILDPGSPVYAFAPDVAILAVQTRDIAPELWDDFSRLDAAAVDAVRRRVAAEFEQWIAAFRRQSRAALIVHGLELAPSPARGILDSQAEYGQNDAIAELNRELRRIARAHSGVYFLDYDALVARHGRENFHDTRKWLSARVPLRAERMLDLAREWLRFLHPLSGKVAKVLALDLDNTLWGGVIGEDGIDGIKLGHEYPGAGYLELQRAVLDLRERGVLLAICSKNNARDALEVFERHPHSLLKEEHFAALRINWEDKASNLRSIARELNLGSDSIAFFDDNPAERELVRLHAPEILVLDFPSEPTKLAETLRGAPVFERLSLSNEDRERSRYYAQDRQRAELEASSGSLEDFYRSLQIVVEVAKVTRATLARTAQLTQKTNQFNLTTRRYGEPDISTLQDTPGVSVLTVRSSDRFGDNGLVGVAIVRVQDSAAELDTLLLSCRVIGRTIETALLSHVATVAREAGAARLVGKFIATKKNGPARDFFARHGFGCVRETELDSDWELDLSNATPSCPAWIELRVTLPEPPSE